MSQGTAHILIVAADADAQVMMSGVLERAGFSGEAVASGEEALTAARARRPDLVVLDLALPGLDGWGVLERLQPDAPPVVLLASRHENPKDGPFQECVAAYLFKPVHPGELAATCRRVLLSQREAAEHVERRQHKRRRLIVKVEVLSRDGSPSVSGRLIDMSASGLQIEMDTVLEPGDRIRVVLHVPGPSPEVEVEGLILWRNPADSGYAYGLDLGRVTATAARVLNSAFASE